MEINQKFKHAVGSFNTETGQMACVGHQKYHDVHLCFKGNMNIPFAVIKLYDSDLAIDARDTYEDAYKLGTEICQRWNDLSGKVTLKKVFNPMHFESAAGEKLSICMRDSGFEFTYEGVVYEAKEGKVNVLGGKLVDNASACPKCENPFPHKHTDGSYSCEECNHTWK